MQRIFEGLRACGVPVPHMVSQADVDEFIDPKLQHTSNSMKDQQCDGLESRTDLAASLGWQGATKQQEAVLMEAMRIYCALEDGSAFSPSFQWKLMPDH